MKSYAKFSVLMIFLCCSITSAGELPRKIKSIWHYGGNSSVYTLFADVGLNAGSFQFFPFKDTPKTGINKGELARWKITVKLAKKNHIIPFAKLYTFGDWTAKLLKHRSYRRVVTETGQRCTLTPCPLERKFWIGIWKPVFIQIATVLKEENCPGGVMLENESYSFGTIYPGFWDMRKRYCFCDSCFAKFLKLQKLQLAQLPARKSRAKWIDTHGLACEYAQFMENEFASIIAELTQSARQIWPEFYVGQYPYFPQWFCDGIIKGSADKNHPCLLFSHIEYFSGFTKLSAQRLKYLTENNFNVKYLGGLTIGYYTPKSLAEKIAELTDKSDGYWLYWGGTLTSSDWKNRLPSGKDFKKLSYEYRLLAPPDEYWKLIKQANAKQIKYSKNSQKLYVTIKTIMDRHNWLARKWDNLSETQIKRHSILFGPDNGRFRGNWYIQTRLAVPDKSWLRLSANIDIKGKEMFTHIGLGKLNWYDWSICKLDKRTVTISRIIKLSNTPSLLINDKTNRKSITIRFHVKPTENIVRLNEINLELIRDKVSR